jgi:hypothetical protein
MAGYQVGNRVRVGAFDLSDDDLSPDEWMARRNAQVAQRGRAELAGRQAWADSIRTGRSVNASQPSHVTALGMTVPNRQPAPTNLSRGYNPNEPRDEHGRWTTGGTSASQPPSWLDRSPGAKAIVGDAARAAGLVPGAARGAWHTVEDIGHGLHFFGRLVDPYDAETSPRGEAAWDKVFHAGKGVVDYTTNAISNPKAIANDVGAGLRRFQVKIDPAASPPASTLADEAARNFNIGLNRGETAFDAVSLLYGGAEAKGLAELGRISEGVGAAKYLARGYPKGLSEYFATPYEGGGHHFLPQRTELPAWLGGGPVPPVISNSPLFLLKPPNMSTGDFLERHFQVDPHYYGGKIPKEFGGGRWSGKKLGWQKHDRLGRLWYGSPAPLKAVTGAGVVGAGAAVDQVWNGKGPP